MPTGSFRALDALERFMAFVRFSIGRKSRALGEAMSPGSSL
jgi:hypothetical protein